MALQYVTLTGDLGTSAANASLTLTASNWLTDSADELLIPPEPVPLLLSAAGSFSTLLLATDNPAPLPAGWSWQASFQLPGINANTFSFFLPAGPYGFTATHGTPAVFTATSTAVSFVNGTGLQLSGGSLPGGFGTTATYYVVGSASDTFELAATSGGTAITSTSSGSGSALTVSTDISFVAPLGSVPSLAAYLPLAGGTMTGPLTLDGTPPLTIPLGATSGYVWTSNSAGQGSWQAGGGGGSGSVASVFGRTGAVTAQSGDYTFSQVTGAGPLLTQTSVQTAAYTAAANQLVPVSTASSAVTVTLPSAPAAGTLAGVKMVAQTSPNTVTILTAGSDVYNVSGGGTAATLSLLNQGMLVQYDSGIWYVVSDDLPLGQLKNLFGFSAVTLTYASTIAVNAALGTFFQVTLTGNATLGAPSNPTNGQPLVFEIIQGTGGNFTLAYNAAYQFSASIPSPTLSTTAGQRDFLSFRYDASISQWCVTGWVPQQNAGIVPIAQGGTGQSTQQNALNALAGSQTSGDYLRGNGVNILMSAIQAADLPAATTSTQGALQLDGTAADILPIGTTGVAGANGKAADSGHVHASLAAIPADFSFQGWTGDPLYAAQATTAGTSLMWLVRFLLRQQAVLTNVYLHVTNAPAGTLTANENFVMVYDSGGTQRAISPDQSTAWGTTGLKEATFTSPYTAPAGSYYLVVNMVVSGGNGPTFRAFTGSGAGLLANAGLSGATLRLATQTAVAGTPASLTYSSNSTTSAAGITAVFT